MRRLIIYLLTIIYSSLLSQGGFKSRIVLQNSLNNNAKSVFEINPGNYWAAGLTVDSLNGNYFNRLAIMGLDQKGLLLWTKKYGNLNFQYLDNVLINRSFFKHNNFILYTGCVKESNNKYVGVLIKFDSVGDTIWQKIYRDSTEDIIPQMCTSSVDGGYLITGFFQNWTDNSRKGLIIKTDSLGNEIWRKAISKSFPNVMDGKGILQDSASKKIVIVGYQYIGDQNYWTSYDNILILDSLGNKLGQYHFTKGLIRDIVQTKDKKFLAVGNAIVPYIPNFQDKSYSYAIKFDINNPSQPLWKITNYDNLSNTNGFNCIVNLPNGNVLIGGIKDTSEDTAHVTQVQDRFTIIDSSGNIISSRYYNYAVNSSVSNSNEILSLNNTSNNGWITASRYSLQNILNPFFFVKYDSTGCDSSLAYCKLKYEVGIEDFNSSQTEVYVFPNPTTGKLKIENQNNIKWKCTLKNNIGQLVYSSEEIDDEIDIEFLEPGIYYLKLENKIGFKVTKIIKI